MFYRGLAVRRAAHALGLTLNAFNARWRRRFNKGYWPGADIWCYKDVEMGAQKKDYVLLDVAGSMEAKRRRREAANRALGERRKTLMERLLHEPCNEPIKGQLLELFEPDLGNMYHVSPPACRCLCVPFAGM